MHQITLRTLLCLILVSQLSVGMAASPAIGVATAKGSFRVDDARVVGNSTLFEGVTVETDAASSNLLLNDGAQVRLASSSRGTVYRNRLVLEAGIGQLENAGDYRIEAIGLYVASDGADSAARVELKEENLVQVAALRGSLRVMNAGGVMLAVVPAGRALEFDPEQAGAPASSSLSGCLKVQNGRYLLTDEATGVTVELVGSDLAASRLIGCLKAQDGHYLLTDETTGVTVELVGRDLAEEEGNRVEIVGGLLAGARSETAASQMVRVDTVKRISTQCRSEAAGAGAAGAGTAAAGAAAAGSTVGISSTAIVAGVIVAGAGTGVAIGMIGGEDTETISR